MAEIEKIEILEKIIRKEYPDLNEEAVSLRAHQFRALGLWMVRLVLKDLIKPNENVFIQDFQEKTENPTIPDNQSLEPRNNSD